MIRVRFAPSPTGHLHVGGARTALVNYLFAKKTHGVFVLRIEDTDEVRSNLEMASAIIDGLKWLKIDWDEGPFFQSERKDYYIEIAEKLLENGSAYRCFCTKEEIEERKSKLKNIIEWKYDRKCLSISPEESEKRAKNGELFVIRCKIPEGKIEWEDIVKGKISFNSEELEDFVILRSDKTPTYNLSVVADDHFFKITHIIRGEDHISNTPKQIILYKGLGVNPPLFGHLPLILGKDRKKLSKRHGTTSVQAFREMGILSNVLFNYLASLGTNIEIEKNCLSREEIIEKFDLNRIKKSSSVFDEEKLLYLNGRTIPNQNNKELQNEIFNIYGEKIEENIINLLKKRAKTLKEIKEMAEVYKDVDLKYDSEIAKDIDFSKIDTLKLLIEKLEDLDDFSSKRVEEVLRDTAEKNNIEAKNLIHPCRFFLLNRKESPPLFDVFEVLGKEISLKRLKNGLKWIEKGGYKNV